MHENLSHFIKERLNQGATETEIIEELKKSGAAISDINIAMAEAKGVLVQKRIAGSMELLRLSWIQFRSQWLLFAKILAIPLAINILPSVALLIAAPNVSQQDYYSALIQTNPFGFIAGFFLWIAVLGTASLFSQMAIFYTITHASEIPKASEAYKKALRYIFPLIWIQFIASFIISGGYFLFVIPGLLFMVWFQFSLFALFEKNVRGMHALQTSKAYVKDYFWPVLGRMLVVILAVFVFAFAASIIITIVTELTGSIGADFKKIVKDIGEIIFGIIFLLLAPFVTIYFYLLYQQLQEIKGEIQSPEKSSFWKYVSVAVAGWVLFFGIITAVTFFFSKYWTDLILERQIITQNIDLHTIRVPLSIYYDKNGKFPVSLQELVPKYTDTLPATFQNESGYMYSVENNGKTYTLCSVTEGKTEECVNSN